jgi:hypothetical protein
MMISDLAQLKRQPKKSALNSPTYIYALETEHFGSKSQRRSVFTPKFDKGCNKVPIQAARLRKILLGLEWQREPKECAALGCLER